MDVSTINSTMKTPIEKPEGEQHVGTPQESDPAFLQLLAGLGLIQSIPSNLLDAEKRSAVNGGQSP
ncbi:MAG TPA: hypothetical protein VJV04_14995, partial [Nitrospiraceae bacterium]|nr:hypothetical protein [Nitrospiraceae bacterium]